MEENLPEKDTPAPGEEGDPLSIVTDASGLLSYAAPEIDLEKQVRVGRFASEMEANLAKLKLEAEGVKCRLAGESLAAGMGTYPEVSGQLELFVARKDLPAARKILDAIEARRMRRLEGNVKMKCPRCGSEQTRKGDRPRLVAGVALIVAAAVLFVIEIAIIVGVGCVSVGVYLLITSLWRRRCVDCGLSWTPAETEEEETADESEDGDGESESDESGSE